MKQRYPVILLTLVMLLISVFAGAATVQLPEWFNLSASLAAPPELGKPVAVNIKLQMLIGNLENASIRLLLPENWKSEPATLTTGLVSEGQTAELSFNVTPGCCLNQGSIVVEALLPVPQAAIIERITKEFPGSAEGMIASVKAWPAETKRYTDIAFALFADESFYPLTGGMWLAYDDSLAPEAGFRGPVYFEDTLISAHQAQTDVEMYDKLQNVLKADANFAAQLAESGIDIKKKRQDLLNGLYVLGVKAWQAKNFSEATGFIEQLEKLLEDEKSEGSENLKISAANLKGVVFWSQGQKRLAEDSLKKAFYANRKHPLQRYVLRNIGLLMLANRDRQTALQMFELALPLKQGFTLLEKEAQLLRKN
ncbi:MAG TPA: tetratricopeptide repeat protein [Candidatus Rifleibacterium sp.]|nr:tetratricopeptide repeat protein [Candidatus Rifleibacterium sp.]HPT45492.1 tetratricopeptide repeat protein [Candidatus Rifleibacterium sp.]